MSAVSGTGFQLEKTWADSIITVTVQQVCALAALTVRKHRLEGKNPISEADLEWIFARNYEGTEQLQKPFVYEERGAGWKRRFMNI